MSDPNFSIDDLLELFGDQGDVAHKETDKRINRVRNRLADEYKQAEKELKKKTDQYFAKFKEQDEQKRKLVQEGKLSQEKYIEWRKNKMLYGETMRQNTERMAEYLANVDQRAADIINGQLAGVYATNYNFASYTVESKNIGASFTLHDDRSVARLARDNPRLLPKVDPDKVKGQAWSRRKINNVITQGILQGKAIPDIAKGLSQVVGMEWNSAVRNARTAMTGAENAGRLGSYQDAKNMGIKLRKQWMATLDERTRESHAEIDGEIVDIDKEFSNGLMYPADPNVDAPAEIYNCRCTMVADLEGVPKEPPAQTFAEWQEEKKKPLHTAEEREEADRRNIQWSRSGKMLKDALIRENVEYLQPKTMSKRISEDEIIKRIGGGDKTKGSCVSLCYAYVGNKYGLDVYDFRGGKSREVMSFSLYNTPALNKVLSKIEKGGGTRAANKLISTIEDGKEYILGTGRHAAIIRKHNGKVEYLELQTENNNGWHELTNDVLKNRFACASSYKSNRSELIDIDSLKDSDEFRELLGYINTKEKDQKKGRGGFAK